MTLFEYDTRPATPQLLVVGTRASTTAYSIRDFLTRNGLAYAWIDADDAAQLATVPGPAPQPADLPLCILPDSTRIPAATVEKVAAGLGLVAAPRHGEYDLCIVGAGPAGLGAAVYAASEGLTAVAVEAVAPGGQAGTTSLIENYLGFPNGISGSELASRAVTQARRFGAEILLTRRLTGIAADGDGYLCALSDGSSLRSQTVIVATGVAWRRLEVPGVDALLGAGVYYGAGPSEAIACAGAHVVLVGGGNSAGQAALRFSRYARQVTVVIRRDELGHSMSSYLVDRVRDTPNIAVRTRAQVAGVAADERLRAVLLDVDGAGEPDRLPADALFVCIGGTPRTDGIAQAGAVRDSAGYLLTGAVAGDDAGAAWPLQRPPLPLETSLPGVFAAGDVRHGSIKRCAAAIGEGSMAVALVHQRLAELHGE